MRRSSPRQSAAPRLHTLCLQAPPSRRATLDDDEMSLRSRIEELERQLREEPEVEFRRRCERRQTIPPPEWGGGRPRPGRGGNGRRLTRQEQRALAREQWRHVLISGGLVLLLIGLINWVARVLQS